MTQPRTEHDLLERLVAICLDRRATDGAGVVAAVCGEHPELAPKVERLLAVLDGLGLDAGEEPAAAEPVVPLLPRAFGRFRLLELLGSGGMGAVYLAEDVELGRRVALKLIRGELLHDPKARSRFRREVEVLARLDHPNLCTIHEAGETEGQPWIAMRLVAGRTLRDMLADEAAALGAPSEPRRRSELGARPRLDRWLAVIEQAARAVHHAHEAGLVHRDLKPGNLMLAPAGDVVVLDFGLARDETDATGLTATDDRLGTLAYMAPEQVEPRGRRVDRRTDVYALGVSLYELLTLELPYEGHTAGEIERCIVQGARRRARRLVPRLPPELDWVLDRALDADPARRYATALELAEDLQRLRQREPVLAQRQSAALRLRRWTQRNPMGAALVAVLALGLLSSLVLLMRGDRALARSQAMGMARLSASLQAQQPSEALVLAHRAAKLLPDVETLSQLDQALLGSPSSRRLELPIADPLTVREWILRAAPGGEAVLCLASYDAKHASPVLITEGGTRPLEASSGAYDAAWSPDGARFVTTSATPVVEVWHADGRRLQRIEAPAAILQARFFPDGERLLFGGEDGIARVFDRRTDTWQALEPSVAAPCCGLDLGTNGRLAVVVGSDHRFVVHDLTRGESRRGSPAQVPRPGRGAGGLLDRAVRVQVASEGRWFTTTTESERITRLFGSDGRERRRFGGLGDGVLARFSPDGRWLLTSHVDQRGRIWDVTGEEPVLHQVLVGHEAVVWDGCFSADSGLVATRSADRSVRVFEVRTGQPVAVLRDYAAEVRDIVFASQGREIVAVAQQGSLHRQVWMSIDHPVLTGMTSGVRWSFELGPGWPGTLVTGDSFREITFWNAARRPVARHQLEQARMSEAALAPSGRWLAVVNRRFVLILAPPCREAARFPVGSDWAQLAFGPGDRLLMLHRTAEESSRLAMLAADADGAWRQLGDEELAQVLPAEADQIYDVAWDPASGLAVTGGRDGSLRVHDFVDGRFRLRHAIDTGWARVSRVALAGSARRVVAASGDGRIVLYDLDGRRLAEAAGQSPRVTDLEITADGRRFLVTGATPGVRIYDDTGQLVLRLHPPHGLVLDARFDSTGRAVWIGSSAQSLRLAPIEPHMLLSLAEARIDATLQETVGAKYPELGSW